jgi:hypothetical protein
VWSTDRSGTAGAAAAPAVRDGVVARPELFGLLAGRARDGGADAGGKGDDAPAFMDRRQPGRAGTLQEPQPVSGIFCAPGGLRELAKAPNSPERSWRMGRTRMTLPSLVSWTDPAATNR